MLQDETDDEMTAMPFTPDFVECLGSLLDPGTIEDAPATPTDRPLPSRIEMWKYPDWKVSVQQQSVSDAMLDGWLQQGRPQADGTQPIGGMKIYAALHPYLSATSSDGGKDGSVVRVLRHFGIPPVMLALTHRCGFGLRRYPLRRRRPHEEQLPPTCYSIKCEDYTVIWSFISDANITNCALLLNSIENAGTFFSNVDRLMRCRSYVPQPMLITATFLAANYWRVNRARATLEHRKIALEGGRHAVNYSGSQAESDGEEAIDLSEKSSVSSHAVSAGNDLVYLARLVISDIRLAFVVTEALRQSYERNGQQILAEQAKAMIVALELIQAEAMGHEGFGLFMKDEANFHQTRVLSLVAQRDQRTSLGIATASQIVAKDSRQDVASMIVIAAVTMVLLPGTFMAVRFSKPLHIPSRRLTLCPTDFCQHAPVRRGRRCGQRRELDRGTLLGVLGHDHPAHPPHRWRMVHVLDIQAGKTTPGNSRVW